MRDREGGNEIQSFPDKSERTAIGWAKRTGDTRAAFIFQN